MRNHSAALLCTACVVWCLMTAGTRNVHPADLRFDPQRLNGITDRMRGFVESKQIAGAVTLVATPDQTIHLSAVGAADVAGGRAMSPDSIFRIASMTKTITATALMLLVDEGRLSVDDPIEKYLPVFHGQKLHDGNAVSPVTIRDAVTHTAGLYRGRTSTGGTLAETVDEIGRSPLQFVPGSKWQYSSGLTVAGRIIEVVSGMPYEKFLADRIFTPLRMTDTSFVLTQAQAQRLAITYQPAKDGNLTVSTHAFTTRDPTIRVPPNPSGGLYSTARDLARFYQMILSGGTRGQLRFLSTQSLGAMTGLQTDKNIVTGFTPGNGWGLGWCVVRHPQGVSRLLNAGSYGHGGAFGTQAWIDPQRGLLCLLLIQRTNFGNADGSDVRDAFQEEALRADRGIVRSGAAFRPLWNYDKAIELTSGPARVVLSPQAGGRVLVYSSGGKNALFLDEAEKDWQPDGRVVASAGRFDIGPELMIPKRTALWAGDWSGEITGDRSARLTSPKDASTGVQLIRDFSLGENSSELACRQTIMNVSDRTVEWCHWSRTFATGGGICVIPLSKSTRFPENHVLYESGGLINFRNQDENIRVRDGFLEIPAAPRRPKLGFDSTVGWMAYLTRDDLLFVKRFATYPDRVYNEAAGLTISVWYPPGPRVELEPIGPRERLGPGQSASFTEHWSLSPFKFPQGEKLNLKDIDLVVRRLPVTPQPVGPQPAAKLERP